ncbi:SH2 domain-containing protein 1B isoform X3 [Mesocricetus auratus]|uniref:SH2 domain-containing protein 1B isoform X3 n=1 Tax=Mesocricetus auratus TaxID=10036 RepID=A0A3Q0CSK6_MESAU|nr:SH2 domain-containing protein 1B isoform X3 [Mesocricetus auratus]
MDLPYYHGQLTKQECETLLLKGGVDGNYLIRDSESVPGVLCLCVSFKKFVYTYRIFREKHGYYKIQRTLTRTMWLSCLEDKDIGQNKLRRAKMAELSAATTSARVDLKCQILEGL